MMPILRIVAEEASTTSKHVAAFCIHPTLPTVAVATKGAIAEYDLVSGCKLGSTETADGPLVFRYTADATTLIGLTQDKSLVAWETQLWKRKVLAHALDRALAEPLLAVAPGTRPPIYVAARGSREVLVVATGASADFKSKDRQMSVEVKKGLLAIAAHPSDASVLFQLHEDSSLSAGHVSLSQRSHVAVWTTPLPRELKAAEASLSAHQHPERSEDVILLLRTPDSIAALETVHGEPSAPFLLEAASAGARIAGATYMPSAQQLLCYERGAGDEVVARVWLLGAQPGGARLACRELVSRPHASRSTDKQGWQESWLPQAVEASSSDGAAWEVLAHQRTGLLLCVKRAAWGVTATALPPPATAPPAALTTSTVLHTGLDYWSGKGDGVAQHLPVAGTVLYLEQNHMKAFSVVAAQAETVTSFAQHPEPGAVCQARALMHSVKQRFVVVFLQKLQGADGGQAPIAYEFTAFNLESGEANEKPAWTMPGSSGAFIGADEEQVAILDAAGGRVTLYQSRASLAGSAQRPGRSKAKAVNVKGPQPLMQLSVAGRDVSEIFPGPSWLSLPRDGEVALERPSTGLVMWSTPEQLSLTELSQVSSTLRGYGARGGGAAPAAAYSLPLQPQERVLQVAWQDLLTVSAEGSVLDDTGQGKASTVGAVLTTARLLLVSVTLKVLVTLAAEADGAAVSSILWMGPALLFCTRSNQVKQLSWDGSVVPICSLGGGAPTALAAALADRLLLVRGSALAHRKISVLGPLLHGWASLAAMGILPGGIWRARSEMGKLARLHDSSRISPSLLGVLLTAGCADVALALARNDRAQQLPAPTQAAMNAAAGQWQPALQAVREAHKQAMYHPRPPPKGSQLWRRQVVLGRTALAHGQVSAARECWQAAAHWEQLLPLCALQGDFAAVRRALPAAGGEAAALGEQLLQANEGRFGRVSAVGARALAGDWRVAPEPLSGSLAAAAAEVSMQMPIAKTALGMQAAQPGNPDATVTVPPLAETSLLTYIGVDIGNPWKLPSGGKKALLDTQLSMAGSERSATTDAGFSGLGVDLAAPASQPPAKGAVPPVDSAAGSFSQPPGSTGKRDDFDSDSDEAMSETSAPSRLQFKIVIRDKSDNAAAGDADALRVAASSLRLPNPLASPPMGMPRVTSRPGTEAGGAQALPALAMVPLPKLSASGGRNPLPEDLFSSPVFSDDAPAPAAGAGGEASSSGAEAAPQKQEAQAGAKGGPEPGSQQKKPAESRPKDSHAAFVQGVRAMEQGDWEEARSLLSDALHTAQSDEARPQVAQYLTAVRLLEAQGDHPSRAPALSRFAAALKLQDKHKHALVQNAAQINLDAKNYGYTAEQLLWLVTQTASKAPPKFLRKLQETITACEKQGLKNASVSADEDLGSFADIISAAANVAEIDSCIEPILLG